MERDAKLMDAGDSANGALMDAGDSANGAQGAQARVEGRARSPRRSLPQELKRFFWDYDFGRLSWEKDRDFVIGRVLSAGDWGAIRWLLGELGPEELRRWIESCSGRGLEPRQLRFWEVILRIPHRRVSEWIAAGDPAWQHRLGR